MAPCDSTNHTVSHRKLRLAINSTLQVPSTTITLRVATITTINYIIYYLLLLLVVVVVVVVVHLNDKSKVPPIACYQVTAGEVEV